MFFGGGGINATKRESKANFHSLFAYTSVVLGFESLTSFLRVAKLGTLPRGNKKVLQLKSTK